MQDLITIEELQEIEVRYHAARQYGVRSMQENNEKLQTIVDCLMDMPKLIIVASAFITMNKLLDEKNK